MACIKGTSRSASCAFSPDSSYLAAGTMAGAVDLSFSSSANLEIFKLDFMSDDYELPVVGECSSNERFNRLSWSKGRSDTEEYSMGLIAGGLIDGSINLWNPLKLINSEGEVAPIARLQKHAGPVRGLEFNAFTPNLLASGAEKGELYIWDVTRPAEPSHYPPLKGVGSGAQDDVSFVAWNHKNQHILASTSYNGTTVVWDLKRQKPVISFTESNKRRCSVLQWNPDLTTQLIVASDDDRSPSLRVWDVRNTMSPLKEFVGHSKGVIAMEWCPNDSNFLLTCAKDNRTLCWDTSTGEIACELPASTNWNFDIHWYPKIPGVISASSFDGKIGIYNIEACSRLSMMEADFGGTSSSSGAEVRLHAPKWLRRPVGVSFGFGGKLVSVHSRPSNAGSPAVSEVYLHTLVTELSLVDRSSEFEVAMQNRDKTALRALCDAKSQESKSEDDQHTWSFLKVMFEEEGTARTKLLAQLGFEVPSQESLIENNDVSQQMTKSLSLDESATENAELDASLVEKSRNDFLSLDNGEDFFNNLQSPKGEGSFQLEGVTAEHDTLPNGDTQQHEAEVMEDSQESSTDQAIQHALVVGDYKEAISLCISSNRMADALVIAHLGGSALWESTRDQYLKKNQLSYLKVVSALVANDLMRLVNTRPLSSWKETLAILCTFAQREEWTTLCDTLASRLTLSGNTLAATLCYICAGNIDRTVEIWSQCLKSDNDGRNYVDKLQDLMEKTVVLALATEQKHFSASLTKLVENYAELLASQGLLATALEYLKLLGTEETSRELSILRDRIALSAEEKEIPEPLNLENLQSQLTPVYTTGQTAYNTINSSKQYHQETLQQQQLGVPGSPYADGYQQQFTTYQQAPVRQHFQDYQSQTYQSTPSQMFIPQPAPPAHSTNFNQASFTQSVTSTPAVRAFTAAPPPVLKNAEQYQQPTLASHLYQESQTASFPGVPGPIIPSGSGLQPAPFLPTKPPSQIMTPSAPTRVFLPAANTGFTQRPVMGPTLSSAPQSPQPAAAPPTAVHASPATIQTVNTSNVSAELRPVVVTLTRLYNESAEALGGERANPAKKREIDDNSKRIGALFGKLNSGDLSQNTSSKLTQLCQALDSGDFAGAMHIQMLLTTSDWDECNYWLAALKRMIKTKQNIR